MSTITDILVHEKETRVNNDIAISSISLYHYRPCIIRVSITTYSITCLPTLYDFLNEE